MSDKHPHWQFSRGDQTAVAALVIICLLTIGGWEIAQGGLRERMVEVDQVEPQPIQFQVDLNSADMPELMQLPGIGEVLSGRIVESRRNDGPFASADELRRVAGIGPKTMERLRPYLLPLPADARAAD
jgi:competence protein ComEA